MKEHLVHRSSGLSRPMKMGGRTVLLHFGKEKSDNLKVTWTETKKCILHDIHRYLACPDLLVTVGETSYRIWG
jgi:hypothetical protein